MALPTRKKMRLVGFDYNTPGYYFITVCVEGKQKLLGEIVGTGLPDGPQNQLSAFGKIAETQLRTMSNFYDGIEMEKYVVMPNHVHMLIRIVGTFESAEKTEAHNSKIAKFVGTFKRFCNKEYGQNIWQSRSYDHVIRGEADYLKIWQYIDENPFRWLDDCFYME